MKGFYNEEERTSTEKVIIASFKGNKDKPRFQLWLKGFNPQDEEIQPHQELRNGYYYDTFEKFEGVIDTVNIVEETMSYEGTPKKYKRLHVIMKKGGEVVKFDMGTYTGRYAQSFLDKMLSSELDINKPVIMFPFHFTNDENKLMIGIGMSQGKDAEGKPIKIHPPKREEKEAIGVPEPETIETDEGPKMVWGKRAMWIVSYTKNRLLMEKQEINDDATPIKPDPIKPDVIVPPEVTKGQMGGRLYDQEAGYPTTAKAPDPFTQDDDLPF